MGQDKHDELERSLVAAGSGVDGPEAHGCLCGALCIEDAFPAAEWAAELLPDDAEPEAAAALTGLLEDIRGQTRAELLGGEMELRLLLPDDDLALQDRVRGLAAWCAGFLYGLGRSGQLDSLTGDLQEILQDFSEISRAAVTPGEGGEKAERDYAELVEYVRASVQLAFEELAPRRAARPAGGERNH